MASQKGETSEEKHLAEGAARVKFACHWTGQVTSLYAKHQGLEDLVRTLQNYMSEAILELEQTGAAPVLPDGKVAGNAAIKFMAGDKPCILVSKSGKEAHHRMADADFCVVTDFDFEHWSCQYLACDGSIQPTSDTPMHVCALGLQPGLDWPEAPKATLHGHALATEDEAKRHHLPISCEETLCSTPEDSAALLALLKKHSYPKHKIFIRKGHGFIILGSSMVDVNTTFREKLKPIITGSATGDH